MKIYDIVFIAVFAASYIGLMFVADVATKKLSYMWKILYAVPAILVLIYISIFRADSTLILLYLSAIPVFIGFYKETKKLRMTVSAVALALVLITIPMCLLSKAYRSFDFVEEFEQGFALLKEHYSLADHKEVDFDGLYAKYKPEFERINATHDQVENAMLWARFTDEFHDAHTSYSTGNKKIVEEANKRMFGNDYGFSTIKLEDGSFVAINVDKESQAYKEGIKNGTKLISMDGSSLEDMKNKVIYKYVPESDKENAEFYEAFYIAGLGGDSVNIEYEGDNGEIRNVSLEKMGPYSERLADTFDKFDDGYKTGHLTWVNINEDTVLFRIKAMMFDTDSYSGTNYSEMEKEIREKLISLKESGYKNIVIDLRNNGGGSPHMVAAVAKLFDSEGEHFYCGGADVDTKTGNFIKDESTGKYALTDKITYKGEDLWSHGNIVVLVNGMCGSGGDHMAMLFDNMDNAKVIGYTKSMGVGQGTSGNKLISGILMFSVVPTLHENGDIYIDAGKDEISEMHLDVKVPVTMDVVRSIFDDGEDYLLNYVCENEF